MGLLSDVAFCLGCGLKRKNREEAWAADRETGPALLPAGPRKRGRGRGGAPISRPYLCSSGRQALPTLASSSRGGWWGGQAPTWLLEGQAPVAGVLLELDLLQGEEGGSCRQRGHRPGDSSVNRVRSCRLQPLAHHAWGAGGTPSVRAGSPRMTRLVPLVMKGNPGTGSQAAQPDPDPGLWALALLAQTRCPAPRSREAPQRPPRTHCLPAGARAPPETGSRGVSGPPLLTRGSWIHTERQRAAAAGTPLAI